MANNLDLDTQNINSFTPKQQQIIELVQRQTDYDENYIINFLKENDWDYVRLIKQYLNLQTNIVKETSKNKQVNTNQAVIAEMRSFLDKASSQYYRNKEIQEILQQQAQHFAQQPRIEPITESDIETTNITDISNSN